MDAITVANLFATAASGGMKIGHAAKSYTYNLSFTTSTYIYTKRDTFTFGSKIHLVIPYGKRTDAQTAADSSGITAPNGTNILDAEFGFYMMPAYGAVLNTSKSPQFGELYDETNDDGDYDIYWLLYIHDNAVDLYTATYASKSTKARDVSYNTAFFVLYE